LKFVKSFHGEYFSINYMMHYYLN